MYALQTAYVRAHDVNSDWQIADLVNVSVANAMSQYRDIVLVLTNNFLPGTHILDLIPKMDAVNVRAQTFGQWLTLIGNQALPTVKGRVTFTRAWVKYKDAFQAKFHVRCVNPNTHPDVPAPRDLLKDLLVTREDTNYAAVADYALFTAAGILHRSYAMSTGIKVVGAGESLAVSNNNNLGVISFQDVGKIKMLPITEAMISRVVAEQPMAHTTAIDCGEDITNKQVGLVIGGRLHILDGIFHKNSPTGGLIYTSKINMRLLYDYLLNKINLSTVAQTFGVFENGVIREEQFRTDGFIQALLTLPQSFVVLIDCDQLHKEIKGLEACSIPYTGYIYGQQDGIILNQHKFCVAARVTSFQDINKISGEMRLNGHPAYLDTATQIETGVTGSLLPSSPLTNELDQLLWLGTNTLDIIEE